MHVILTHENADFDAIASLLGASKLFPQAVPVLPRRINRNVQAFLNLYLGDQMPFRDPETLPRGRRIERVILVDTHGMVSVRGMPPKVHDVLILDHHSAPEQLPEGWRFQGARVGATTTLLVEAMAARMITLKSIEATLLLAGIYEDTGNLTYASTTARDLRAAAWLFDQGASLDIVMDVLEHGLTEGQRQLYKALEDAAESLNVHGYTIVVSATQAPGDMQEEISTLAHRLRDTLAPDALFILVGIGGYVQLVARSTNAAINVATIAALFGGSGHERAAAAMIRERSVAQVLAELKEHLPRYVEPPITVRDIMSRGVRTVTSTTLIREVDRLMLRTGHEGVPVKDNGTIVGLVTRKAVDHAMQHGMSHEPVSRIMEPGHYSVAPHESIERVRQLMLESGWGQIPVVEEGQVSGIVTRTDLIRGFVPQPSERERRRSDIQQRMEQAFPAPLLKLVRTIGACAAEMDFGIYFVGGIVRDLLLGHWPLVDVDFVIEGDAIALTERLVERYGGELRTHSRFGTAKWLLTPDIWRTLTGADGSGLPMSLDLVTARTEYYESPTVLPSVEWSSIKQDLHRRDFTINTLAISLTPDSWGELLDFYGGVRDLENGVLRVLHSLSFQDDPTRILRAARFEARLNFRLDERSAQLIREALPMLNRITGSRIRHELDLIFREARPEAALARLDEMGVLAQLAPGLSLTPWLRSRYELARTALDRSLWELDDHGYATVLWALFMFLLDEDTRIRLAHRLMLPHALTEHLERSAALVKVLPRLPDCSRPSEVVALLEEFPSPLLALGWLVDESPVTRMYLEHYQRVWRHVRPFTTGADLKRRGLPPGPLYRKVLGALRDAHLDGEISTREEEAARLEQLLQKRADLESEPARR